jgi:futalosine hydrolase
VISTGAVDVAILGAVAREVEPLRRILNSPDRLTVLGESFLLGMYRGRSILIGSTGLGKVNAAVTTTSLLERFPVGEVWNIGCAGAFGDGPLQIGDVLVTLNAFCGDEGILTGKGVLSPKLIGIPILVHHGEEIYDCLPLESQPPVCRIREKTPPGFYRLLNGQGSEDLPVASICSGPGGLGEAEGFQLAYGPSLTVGMVSGDAEVASDRFKLYGAFAENMEGSAVAQACFRFGVPMVECRGISNIAGNRCKSDWRFSKAFCNCHAVILNWLQ